MVLATGDENDLASIETPGRSESAPVFKRQPHRFAGGCQVSGKRKQVKLRNHARSGEPGKYQRLAVGRESGGEVANLGMQKKLSAYVSRYFQEKRRAALEGSPGKPPLGATTH